MSGSEGQVSTFKVDIAFNLKFRCLQCRGRGSFGKNCAFSSGVRLDEVSTSLQTSGSTRCSQVECEFVDSTVKQEAGQVAVEKRFLRTARPSTSSQRQVGVLRHSALYGSSRNSW